ncbi:MAG: MerR family transcriptional regulator [Gammaproteobacteria bacterium]|nr:MerR family transcriptional regulator [Gammaproteobacteria bacterium]
MGISETTSTVDDTPRHPIRLVANRTGLTVDLIRAWEKRYQVVDPARSETQRRLYSDHDIERLRLIRIAKQAGRRLSDIARLPLVNLRAVVSEESRLQAAPEPALTRAASWSQATMTEDQSERIDQLLYSIAMMDQFRFDQQLQQALIDLSLPGFLEQVLGPLLSEIGEATRRGQLRIAHEHMATAHLRTFLGALRFREVFTGTEPKIVVTTPTGQLHELGALMIAALVSIDGWQPVYLGPNTPADEIIAAVKQSGAKAVSLSLTYPADDPRIPLELTRLRAQLPEEVALFVGGSAMQTHQDLIARLGLQTATSLDAFRSALLQSRRTVRLREA